MSIYHKNLHHELHYIQGSFFFFFVYQLLVLVFRHSIDLNSNEFSHIKALMWNAFAEFILGACSVHLLFGKTTNK